MGLIFQTDESGWMRSIWDNQEQKMILRTEFVDPLIEEWLLDLKPGQWMAMVDESTSPADCMDVFDITVFETKMLFDGFVLYAVDTNVPVRIQIKGQEMRAFNKTRDDYTAYLVSGEFTFRITDPKKMIRDLMQYRSQMKD